MQRRLIHHRRLTFLATCAFLRGMSLAKGWWETFPDFMDYVDILVAGVVAWRGRRRNRLGPLMVVAGVFWMVDRFPPPLPQPFCFLVDVIGSAWAGAFAHVVLAFPTGRLGWWLPRLVVTAAYVEAMAITTVRRPEYPGGWLRDLLVSGVDGITVAIGLGVLALQIVKWQQSSKTERHP